MIKTHSIKKSLVLITAVVLILASLISAVIASGSIVAISHPAITNMADASDVDYNKDKHSNGDFYKPGLTPKFGEKDWRGRIEATLHLGGESYIDINVDPRDVWFNDDIIVEYRSYYLDINNNKTNQKLYNFRCSVNFCSKSIGEINKYFYKMNDSQAGFTYASGKGDVEGLKVYITIDTTGGKSRNAEFYFGTKCDEYKN